MKVFFINPPFKADCGKFSRESRSPAVAKSGALYYPLWLIYAAAVVEREGFDVEFLDAPAKPLNEQQSLNFILEKGNDTRLFVVGTSTPSIYSDIAFCSELKKAYPEAFILLVGTHPSVLPDETMQIDNCIDGVARREYDYIVKDLAVAVRGGQPFSVVKGLTYRNGLEILHNEDMPYITELDEIPFAAEFIKKHLDAQDYFFPAASYPEIQLFTGRGCPCQCNFCVYPQVMHGHKYRLRSPENVLAEFMYIAENFPNVKEIVIEDDTFTVSKERVVAFCQLMVANGLNHRFKWLCNARVNLDYETMKLMKAAGCRLIIPGIESGNQTILNNIKKGTTEEQIVEYVKNAKKTGLLIHACYMVGNQGETKQTMQETLQLALKLNTDTAQFFPLIPYPGTGAYVWAKENGYIEEDYRKYCKADGTHNCVIHLPEVSAQELVDFCDEARRKYYLRPRYIMHRLKVGFTNPDDLKRSLKAFFSLKKYLFPKR